MNRKTLTLFVVLSLSACTSVLLAQEGLPDNVEMRKVDVWSDGTRLSGDLLSPKGKSATDSYPAIVMSHGWGGTRDQLSTAYAPYFAAEGFVVLTIDYRGWGDSNSRLVLEGKQPEPGADGKITVAVKPLREIVDPLDQTEDIRSAIDWIQGESGVDPERIGLWGSSYSGGHVIYVAAHDPRVKVTVSQVASMDSIGIITAGALGGPEGAKKHASKMARGEVSPYPTEPAAPGLRGTPHYVRMGRYSPRDVAHKSRAASLFIDAGDEELFDIKENSQAVYSILKNRVPTQYVVIEGIKHYDIYRDKLEEARTLAIEWYKKHL